LKLGIDGVEIVGLVLPKLKLHPGSRIFAIFQCLFGLKLEDTLNLFGPGQDGSFKDVSFILLGSLRMNNFSVRKRKEGAALAQTDHNIGLSHKIIEPFHEIFGDKVSPPLLVVWVLHDRSKNLIAYRVHMFEDVLGDLQEDDIVLEVLLFEFVGPNSKDYEALSLVFVDNGRLGGEGDLISSDREGIQHLVEVVPSQEPIQGLFV